MFINDSNNSARMQCLMVQEAKGEEGFAAYSEGRRQEGAQAIKEAMFQSDALIGGIRNLSTQREARELMAALHDAMTAYVNDPSNANLQTLRSESDTYKSFLTTHQ